MAVRKTLLKANVGVKLTRVEELSANQKVMAAHYRLSTLRPAQPRVLVDLGAAEAAFIVEVAASKKDPTCVRLAAAEHCSGGLP